MVITKETLHEAVQTLEKYRAGKARFEKRVIENEQWWKLRHWEHIKEEGTTPLKTKSAWLVNVILSKHADAMDAYPEPSFLPREQGDEPTAKMLSSVVPVILQDTDFEETWSRHWWKKLKCGFAVYGVFWDPKRRNGLGDVAIRNVDPLMLFWEPGVTDIQRSRNVFHVELWDNETLLEQYPQLKGKLGGNALSLSDYIHDDSVDSSDKSAVIDWYYKKNINGKTVLHYVKFVNDEVLFATEDDHGDAAPAEANGFLASSGTEAPVLYGMPEDEGPEGGTALPLPSADVRDNEDMESADAADAAPDGGMAARGLYDHGEYPFFPDVLFPEEGTITGYGYIDICKDAQRQIDLMNNAIVGNAIASATPRWLKRGDDGINEQEFTDLTKAIVHVDGQVDDSAIKQISVQPLSQNYMLVLQNKIDEMKETSGNRDVNNGGVPSGVTAASAIAAMQEQSGKLSRDQGQGGYRAFRKVCYCVLSLIGQFFDLPRAFRILGEKGAMEYVSFDNRGLQLQSQGGTEFGINMGLRQPVFDIEVTSARQSSYSKLSYNELALQFFQLGFFNPQLADQALAATDMMDFKGKEKIQQRIAENGGMYQQLMAMQAQMQQMAALLGLQTGGGPTAPATAPSSDPRTGSTAETDALGGMVEKNTLVEKARSRAQQATQPDGA